MANKKGVDKRKFNGGHSTKGFAGRKSKREEFGLTETMEKLLPTDKVLEEFATIIQFSDDDKLKLAAIVKWLEWRVGKPKETIDLSQKGKIELNVPKIEFK